MNISSVTWRPQETMATCAYFQHVTGSTFLQAWQHGPSQIHQHFRTLEASPDLSDLPAHQTLCTHEGQNKNTSQTSHFSLDWFKGVSGEIYGKPWFAQWNARVSCEFPLQPIHWILQFTVDPYGFKGFWIWMCKQDVAATLKITNLAALSFGGWV